MLIILLLTTLAWQRASALPISAGPTTVPTIIHNVVFGVFARTSCSDMRSMYEIVRSCLFTIAACVYRAIHPNIPDPNLSFWGKLRVTAKITIYALIAPELMIWWALRQRFGAKVVVEEVNAFINKPQFKWTQTHGQFAQMGGFGRKDDKRILYPPTHIRLLRDGQIDVKDLKLTQKEINDKSKGDILSKALVAFQTTWFIFECLARLQQGLPIIELEVVTLAFATLNAITYALWWYKPLNVMCPISLPIHPILVHPPATIESPAEPQAGPSIARGEEEPLVGGVNDTRIELDEVQTETKPKGKKVAPGFVTTVQVTLQGVLRVMKKDLNEKGWFRTIVKWLIVTPFAAVGLPLYELLGEDKVDDEATCVSTFYANEIPNEKFDWLYIPSSLIGMVFGAIHFISWDSPFPTRVQLILWRISSVIMVVQPLLILLLRLCEMIARRSPARQQEIAEAIEVALGILSFAGGTIPYIFSRFAVLVLAFLTLRDLPPDSLTNISWTTYIPHF